MEGSKKVTAGHQTPVGGGGGFGDIMSLVVEVSGICKERKEIYFPGDV